VQSATKKKNEVARSSFNFSSVAPLVCTYFKEALITCEHCFAWQSTTAKDTRTVNQWTTDTCSPSQTQRMQPISQCGSTTRAMAPQRDAASLADNH